MSVPGAILILLGSFVCGDLAVRWSIWLATRVGAYDVPDDRRKLQARPIPRLGGVAVAVAFSACAFAGLIALGLVDVLDRAAGVLMPALAASVVGLQDDRRAMSPWTRLAAEAAIGVSAWLLGARATVFDITLLDLPLTVFWIVLLINSVNLLDNSDGMAAIMVLVCAAGVTLVAVLLGQILITALGTAVCGVTLGFLHYNWHPARVYLGDSGAYFLGALLAILIIKLRPDSLAPWQGVVIAVLLVVGPLLDTTFVVVRRLRAGISPFTAGRDHMSHTLQSRGIPVPDSAATLALVPVFGSCLAVIITMAATWVGVSAG